MNNLVICTFTLSHQVCNEDGSGLYSQYMHEECISIAKTIAPTNRYFYTLFISNYHKNTQSDIDGDIFHHLENQYFSEYA